MLRLSTLNENVQKGYFGDENTGRDIVAWCFSNSFQIVDPVPNPREWRYDQLPLFPALDEVSPSSPEAKESIVRIVEMMRAADSVICAMEPTTDGQLLFQDLLTHARDKMGVNIPDSKCFRIWPHVKKPEAIRSALKQPLPNELFKHVAKSAHLRRYIDWSSQYNYSKLYTLLHSRHGEQIFQLNRIQLAVMKAVTERYLERREFKPKPFYEVHLECLVQGHGLTFRWTKDTSNLVPYDTPSENQDPNAIAESESTTIEKPKYLLKKPTRHFATESKDEATRVANAVESTSTIVAARVENVNQPPPLLYNLTSLQREAYERYSIPAHATHTALLALYEKLHLITNPNTSSHQLPTSKAGELKEVVHYFATTKKYAPLTRDLVSMSKIDEQDGRVFDLSMGVMENHAIVPTATSISWWQSASSKKASDPMTETMTILYDMIVRRLLSAMMPDVVHSVITVTLENADQFYFEARAAILKSEGWRMVGSLPRAKAPFKPGPANWPSGYIPAKMGDDESARESVLTEQKMLYKMLSALRPGDEIRGVIPATAVPKDRSPPPLFTQSRALALMEDTCTFANDRLQYSYGLGTPQERADVLTKLLAHNWLRSRQDRYLEPSRKAIILTKLIQDDSIADISNSHSWDNSLNLIMRGRGSGSQLIKRFKALLEPELQKHVADAQSPETSPLPVSYDLIYYHTNDKARDINTAPPSLSQLRCPKCHTKGMLKQGPTSFFCAAPKCNWSMPQSFAEHQLTTEEVKTLLQKKENLDLTGLVDKFGNTFKATLVLQPPHYHMFFRDREITQRAEKPQGAQTTEKLQSNLISGNLDLDVELLPVVPRPGLSKGRRRGVADDKVKKPKMAREPKDRKPSVSVTEARLQESIARKIQRTIAKEAKLHHIQHLRANPVAAPFVGVDRIGRLVHRPGRPKIGEYNVPKQLFLRGRKRYTKEQQQERLRLKGPRHTPGRPTRAARIWKIRETIKLVQERISRLRGENPVIQPTSKKPQKRRRSKSGAAKMGHIEEIKAKIPHLQERIDRIRGEQEIQSTPQKLEEGTTRTSNSSTKYNNQIKLGSLQKIRVKLQRLQERVNRILAKQEQQKPPEKPSKVPTGKLASTERLRSKIQDSSKSL
jgi:DNA topoisomerase-3